MRFYTSDLHLGHKNIIKYSNRPFDDVDHMNHVIIKNINEVTTPDDELWILGDLAMGRLEDSLSLIKLMNPTVHLVSGNHDRCWGGAKAKDRKKTPLYYEAGIASIQDEAVHDIDERMVVLSHFPYRNAERGDHTEVDRFEDYRPINHGLWLLCGHVHETWMHNDKMINVGVDVQNFYPVSEDGIIDFMRRNENAKNQSKRHLRNLAI